MAAPMPPSEGSEKPARAASAVADPLVGAVLADRYEIVRRIGEGGMGAVYEARHTVIGKRVAVKVLLEKFVEKADLVARLLQEARLASSIGHENIVDVTDFGTTADGRAFVVMEFLEGEPLADLVIREAPLAVDVSLGIARQVAGALAAAHAKGIVHRDVKPENVYLVRRGDADFVKVVDFGVSKAVASREDGPEWQRLTRTGMVLGTPLYMSPEQARGGDDVDARADVWAVGVMLYECLTGEVPFRANNYLGVISQVLTSEAVPVAKLRPELGIPAAVEAVVMRALEKDRDRRYQLMSDLERDLDRLLAGDQNVGLGPADTVAAPQVPVRPARGRWHLGVAAVVAIGVGIAVALARTEGENPAALRAPAASLRAPSAAPSVPTSPPAAPVGAVPQAPPVASEPGKNRLGTRAAKKSKSFSRVQKPAAPGVGALPPPAASPGGLEQIGGEFLIPAGPKPAGPKSPR